jgi:isochorismate pyruvate lyase
MSPDECKSMEDVRAQIDRIDARIVRLLAERGGFVHRAAQFKTNPVEVRAADRVEQVIARVRALAVEAGADPDVVEPVYRSLIAAFTRSEMDSFQAASAADPTAVDAQPAAECVFHPGRREPGRHEAR